MNDLNELITRWDTLISDTNENVQRLLELGRVERDQSFKLADLLSQRGSLEARNYENLHSISTLEHKVR